MISRRSVLTGAGAGFLALAVLDQAEAARRRRRSAPGSAYSAQLRQIFAESDEAFLKRSPINALFRGDMRYADQFGDYLSDASIARAKSDVETDLKRLKAIPRDKLSQAEQVSYDVFEYTQAQSLRGVQPPLINFPLLMPVDHFNGIHIFFPQLQSGQSAAPYKTVADYENGLKRIEGFIAYLTDAEKRMREGMAKGLVQPKLVMNNVVGQFEGLIKTGIVNSPYMMPIANLPKDMAEADKQRLTAAYNQMMEQRLMPAQQKMLDFIKSEYLPKCRETVGLSSLPGGLAYYEYLVEVQTTTKMTADEIHKVGLSQVAYLLGEIEKTKTRIGFAGDLKAYFDHLREDPKLKFPTKEALLAGYEAIRGKVEKGLPTLFRNVPKTPFEIQAVPDFQEKNSAGAYYQPGTPDAKRPGVFYVNTYDLPSRTSPGMETLFLHEAVPGHHYQISLAQENAQLPNFQRFGGNVAYVEGWALYAESLGPELGMFTDPYQYQGHLDDAMLRAVRLVLDTGLHAKGWTRDQSMAYMLANSGQSMTDAVAEVERYIAIPGQALGYMLGKLKLRDLREKSAKALGPKFDIRDFHDEVLMTGALPLDILDKKIKDWAKFA
jgi:uncharacterized protein (DUF885 family)